MAETEALVQRLVEQSVRIRRLPPPWQRVVVWLGYAIPYVALAVLMMGVRSDLGQKFSEPQFLTEQIAALATALTASFAAFRAVIPGRAHWPFFLPAFSLAVWLGSLGHGCIQAWTTGNLVFSSDWMCLPAIAFAGAGPAAVIAFMIRRGAPLYPHMAVALGGLAAAAIGNAGLRLFHPTDASLMVLVWQFGSVALLSALAGYLGPFVHHWRHVSAAP